MALSLEDRQALIDLRSHYSWALSTQNPHAYIAVHTPDAVLDAPDYPNGPGVRVGHEQLFAMVDNIKDDPFSEGMQHYYANPIFEGDENQATVRWMSILPHMRQDGIGIHRVCAYIDTCVKIDGKWYLKHIVYRQFTRADARAIGSGVDWRNYTGDVPVSAS